MLNVPILPALELLILRIAGPGGSVIATMMNRDRNKKTAFAADLSYLLGILATTFVVEEQLIEQ